MPLFVVIASLWPVPPENGITVKVPRSWMLGRERSACVLRMAEVNNLLGPPDTFFYSSWIYRCNYRRLGVAVWFEWECPAMRYCLANGLGRETRAALRVLCPAHGRPLLRVMETQFMPRESLIGVGWFAWGMRGAWRCE